MFSFKSSSTKGDSMQRLVRMGGGLLLASALSLALVALPAGAAIKSPAAHTTSTATFASEVASLQGHAVTLSNGATCSMSLTTCKVASSGTSSLANGTVLSLAPVGELQARRILMPVGAGLGVGIGLSGLLGSLELIMFFIAI